MSWLQEAPRRLRAHVEAATIESPDESVWPALAFAFESPDAAPVTCVFVGREIELRRLQRELDKAITAAIRQVKVVT